MPEMSALVVVDVQRDFCPGGALAVSRGDAVVPIINAWIQRAWGEEWPVAVSRDWHPAQHCSFRSRGGPWPPHCVAETPGAQFHPELLVRASVRVFSKGSDPDREAYSAFDGVSEVGQPLALWLRARGVNHLYVGGLATDYCVKATVLDALAIGFGVSVLRRGIRGVNVHPGDAEAALKAMRARGARLIDGLTPPRER